MVIQFLLLLNRSPQFNWNLLFVRLKKLPHTGLSKGKLVSCNSRVWTPISASFERLALELDIVYIKQASFFSALLLFTSFSRSLIISVCLFHFSLGSLLIHCIIRPFQNSRLRLPPSKPFSSTSINSNSHSRESIWSTVCQLIVLEWWLVTSNKGTPFFDRYLYVRTRGLHYYS